MNLKNGFLILLLILFGSLLIILQKYTREYHSTLEQTETFSAANIPAPRFTAQNFSLLDLNGNEAQLSNYRGSVVLILFWTTW